MKKVLSIVLAVAMLISIFAVNASAMMSFTYTEIVGKTDDVVMVEQDFSVPEKEDYTSSAGYYSNSTVENGCVTLSTKDNGTVLHVSSVTPITAEQWTLEFDVKRNSEMTNTQYYGVIVGCEKAAYKDDADKTAKSLNKYAIYLPLQDKEKDTWYTYRIAFDETQGTDWWSTLLSIISSAQYKKAGDTEWTPISVSANYNWAITGNQARPFAVNNYLGAGETSFMFRSMTGTTDATELANANFSMDNIKAYVPGNPGEEVVKNYPLTNGTIHLAKEAPAMPDASTGANTNGQSSFTTNMTTPAADAPQRFTVSFDAKNTVQGMPLMFHTGSANQGSFVGICSTDTIGNDWYSYKFQYTGTASGDNLTLNGIYRKPLGSDDPWTKLTPVYYTSYNSETGADVLTITPQSNQRNAVRIYYHSLSQVAMYPGSTWENTVWEVANLQVTDEATIAGFANLVDGTITVDAEIIAASGDAGVALAVYDNDDRLYDVDFKKLIGGAGDLDMTVNYVEGYDANLLVWNFANGTITPLVSTISIAEIAK